MSTHIPDQCTYLEEGELKEEKRALAEVARIQRELATDSLQLAPDDPLFAIKDEI